MGRARGSMVLHVILPTEMERRNEHKLCEIRDSIPGKGRGVYAKTTIPKDTFIAVYPGNVYNISRLPRDYKYSWDYPMLRVKVMQENGRMFVDEGVVTGPYVIDPADDDGNILPMFQGLIGPLVNEPSVTHSGTSLARGNIRIVHRYNTKDMVTRIEYWSLVTIPRGAELLVCYGGYYPRQGYSEAIQCKEDGVPVRHIYGTHEHPVDKPPGVKDDILTPLQKKKLLKNAQDNAQKSQDTRKSHKKRVRFENNNALNINEVAFLLQLRDFKKRRREPRNSPFDPPVSVPPPPSVPSPPPSVPPPSVPPPSVPPLPVPKNLPPSMQSHAVRVMAKKAIAIEDVKINTRLARYPGRVYDLTEFDAAIPRIKSTLYFHLPDEKTIIDPTDLLSGAILPEYDDNVALYIREPKPNEVPNVKYVKVPHENAIEVWASRTIPAGTELMTCFGLRFWLANRPPNAPCATIDINMTSLAKHTRLPPLPWTVSYALPHVAGDAVPLIQTVIYAINAVSTLHQENTLNVIAKATRMNIWRTPDSISLSRGVRPYLVYIDLTPSAQFKTMMFRADSPSDDAVHLTLHYNGSSVFVEFDVQLDKTTLRVAVQHTTVFIMMLTDVLSVTQGARFLKGKRSIREEVIDLFKQKYGHKKTEMEVLKRVVRLIHDMQV